MRWFWKWITDAHESGVLWVMLLLFVVSIAYAAVSYELKNPMDLEAPITVSGTSESHQEGSYKYRGWDCVNELGVITCTCVAGRFAKVTNESWGFALGVAGWHCGCHQRNVKDRVTCTCKKHLAKDLQPCPELK